MFIDDRTLYPEESRAWARNLHSKDKIQEGEQLRNIYNKINSLILLLARLQKITKDYHLYHKKTLDKVKIYFLEPNHLCSIILLNSPISSIVCRLLWLFWLYHHVISKWRQVNIFFSNFYVFIFLLHCLGPSVQYWIQVVRVSILHMIPILGESIQYLITK